MHATPPLTGSLPPLLWPRAPHRQMPDGTQAQMITARSGTLSAGSTAATQLTLGKMAALDMVRVGLVVSPHATCSGGPQAFSLSALLLSNGTTVAAEVSPSSGATIDGGGISFDEYATVVATVGLDAGASIAVNLMLNLQGLTATCSTFMYNMTITSTTAPFDPSFVTTGGTPVPTVRRATLNDIQAVTDATATVVGQLAAATTRITALEARAAAAEAALNTSAQQLAEVRAAVRALQQLTADYGVLSDAIDNLTHCQGRGMLLAANNVCTHATPACPATGGGAPAGVTLAWGGGGDAVPGTIARLVCPAGNFEATGGTVTCRRDGTWASPRVQPVCRRCPASCTACRAAATNAAAAPGVCTACVQGRVLLDGQCFNGNGLSAQSPLLNCASAADAGLGSRAVWLNASGTVYRAFCLNDDNVNGWGSAQGGGWEVVHTQVGGHSLFSNPVPNIALRQAPNVAMVSLPDIRNGTGRPTQRSQMSAAWAIRAAQPGLQWMKFMAKIQVDTLRGTDSVRVDLPPNMPFAWLFSRMTRTYCATMPGQVEIFVNGRSMGRTNQAKFQTTSIGFANRGYDTCGQGPANYIDTNRRSTWRKIDDQNTDNSIRHLVTYNDRSSSPTQANRCNYCCWGCPGWREVVVWAVRPRP